MKEATVTYSLTAYGHGREEVSNRLSSRVNSRLRSNVSGDFEVEYNTGRQGDNVTYDDRNDDYILTAVVRVPDSVDIEELFSDAEEVLVR